MHKGQQTTDKLKEISNNINTQDNRITQDPLFAVQRKVRVFGFDMEYCDDFLYVNKYDPEIVLTQEEAELEENQMNLNHFNEVYYKDHWEFVTACFTEKGCEDYIKANGHNLGETRIYAYSAYRNDEWITLREFLKNNCEYVK